MVGPLLLATASCVMRSYLLNIDPYHKIEGGTYEYSIHSTAPHPSQTLSLNPTPPHPSHASPLYLYTPHNIPLLLTQPHTSTPLTTCPSSSVNLTPPHPSQHAPPPHSTSHLHTPHNMPLLLTQPHTSTPLTTCPSSSLNLTSRLTSTGSRSFSARSAILLCCSTFCSVSLRSSWYCTPHQDRQTSTHVHCCLVCSLLYYTNLFAVIRSMYIHASVLRGLPWQHAINKRWRLRSCMAAFN